MVDSAFHFHADDLELRIGSENRSKGLERFADGIEFRTTLAADGDDDFVDLEKWRRLDSNGTWTNISLRIRETEENLAISRGHRLSQRTDPIKTPNAGTVKWATCVDWGPISGAAINAFAELSLTPSAERSNLTVRASALMLTTTRIASLLPGFLSRKASTYGSS